RHYVTPWQFSALRMVDALLPARLRDQLLAKLKP
ncbi:MAG TPA: oxidoreductase, partial [Erythrobacter sp.]|nr:oxidoreductase [Erythrobacter sp.]